MDMIAEIKSAVASALNSAKGVVITTEGVIAPHNPKNGIEYDLKQLQDVVGDTIEIVQVIINGKRYHLVCDDNGCLKGLPGNIIASIVYGGNIVGNVLICEYDTIK